MLHVFITNANKLKYSFKCLSIAMSVLLYLISGTARAEEEKQLNVAYGTDSEQIMDIYIPKNWNRQRQRKVIVAIHGGGWGSGSKAHMQEIVDFFRDEFSDIPIVNMDYRLGSASSPGYPKQLQDIQLALDFLGKHLEIKNPEFALIGVSAGSHLALLFAYQFDKHQSVKSVVDIVGPTDFTDPFYAQNPVSNVMLSPLIGPSLYFQNPELYKEVSPVNYVSSECVPTVCFYGVLDPLVPISQGNRIKDKLESAGVVHKYYTYPGGHYVDWSQDEKNNVYSRAARFLRRNFF